MPQESTAEPIPPGLTAQVMQWVRAQQAAGVAQDALLRMLRKVGWSDLLARRALELPEAVAQAAENPTSPPRPLRSLPGPDLQGAPCSIDAGDRLVHVLLHLQKPCVVLFGNLLGEDECTAIIAAAQGRMARSRTVARDGAGEEVNADRTSEGMFFQRGEIDVVQRVEARIARLLRWPLQNGEGMQVLHYRPGTEYKPHYDYFAPDAPGTAQILARGGQRVGTLILYLNETEGGGSTVFPETGLHVMPRAGCGVFFSYERPDPASGTLHGGAPVLAGEKWIATKWLREGEFV